MTERQPVVTDDLQRFVELVATLRRDCPWDAEQTHSSLRSYLLEEAHELLEALDAYDEATGSGSEDLKEELGDLLFQVVFHARIAADDGRFDLADVARGIHDKLRHRHPHVFGDVVAEDSGQVLTNWDRIKQAEKGRESALDGSRRLFRPWPRPRRWCDGPAGWAWSPATRSATRQLTPTPSATCCCP